jgi:hypothetical protein
MTDSVERGIPKFWLNGIAVLISASPPALLLWFQGALVPYVSSLAPVIVIRVIAALLLTILSVLAYLVLQRPWLKWEESTGTWVNRLDGLRYCGTCRAKKILSPLKNEVTGWRCVACGTFRTDPKRKSKEPPPPPKPTGPNAWMA